LENSSDTKAKPRWIIGFFQIVLLSVGCLWVLFFSDGHFDETQIPGFFIALAISWWLTAEVGQRAINLQLVDRPGEARRIHTVPIPRLGGVAIFISVMVTFTILIALTGRFPKDARAGEGLAGIAIGGTLIFVLGLMDDLESVPAKRKLIVQMLAACAAYSLGVRIKSIPMPMHLNFDFGLLHLHGGLPIELGIWSLPLTVIWLVGITNAVNLIDGMDGLAAGVSAISALTIWSVAMGTSIDRPYAALVAAVLAGALLGFLRWNFNPARIFLGDSGAYLTGFILAAVSITGVIKGAAAATLIVPTFLLVLLILFFPILDTTWAILRRVATGRSIFEPDAAHIHHRLLGLGYSQKKTAYLLYGVSASLGFLAAYFVHQQYVFLKLGAMVILMALFFAEVLNGHRQRRSNDDKNSPAQNAPLEKENLAEVLAGHREGDENQST
jgi:UDP-GlcNAc:undecaprenyl-phosphate GlcNAc-1-phosphate transferase